MTRVQIWLTLAAVIAGYWGLVYSIGFAGFVAETIQFLRIMGAVATLIVFGQMVPRLFEEVPPPRRDLLHMGIVLVVLSGACFSFFNEAARILGIENSVFTNPISGMFALFLVLGFFFLWIAPYTLTARPKIWAFVISVFLALGMVFVAPHFREAPPVAGQE